MSISPAPLTAEKLILFFILYYIPGSIWWLNFFIACAKCLSHEGLQRIRNKLWLLQQKCQSKQRNLDCPPVKLTFFADLSPQTIGLPLNFAHHSWTFPFLAHIHAAELFRRAPISPVWNGRDNAWRCQAEDYIFLLVEVSGSSESL